MSWLSSFVRPKLRRLLRREMPEDQWISCPLSGALTFRKDAEENLHVIPSSDYHLPMPSSARLSSLFDGGVWTDATPRSLLSDDPLQFRDRKRYVDRLKQARSATGCDDAMRVGIGELGGRETVIASHEFAFMGGSMGRALGDAIVGAFDLARSRGAPAIVVAASGGARMQEGILSLMQMPRALLAARSFRDARLPYIAVLANPTTGGVAASYAMRADVHIAEPGAAIGFAGRRVIEQTLREKLPDAFQSAESLMSRGMVDMVVHRRDLRDVLIRLLNLLTANVSATIEEGRGELERSDS